MRARIAGCVVATLVGLGALVVAAPPGAAQAAVAATPATVVDTPTGLLTTRTLAVTPAGPQARTGADGFDVAVDPGTQMVGVSWAGSPEADVEVRAHVDGTWSDWTHMSGDGPDVEPTTGRTGAGPAWFGSAGTDRIGLRVAAGSPTDLHVETMRFTPRATTQALTVDRPATPAGGPPIHTRGSWAPGGWQGQNQGCYPAPYAMPELRFGVVHHTVNANTYSAADVPGILAGIYRFHTGTQGWCDIAYNLLIDRFGRVWEGRLGGLHQAPWGGHTKGFNVGSTGVALLGQHQPGASPGAVSPSGAAMTALRDVLAWKLGSHGVDPTTSIPIVSGGSTRYPEGRTVVLPTLQGHRDTSTSSCPGDLVYGQLAALRGQVAGRISGTNDAGRWAPSQTGPRFFGRIHDAAAGRDMPNGTVGHYTSLVTRGGWPRNPLASALVLSTTTEHRIGLVDRLYRAAFTREAESSGLTYWVGRRDRGMTVTSMARSFATSAEFRGRYDALADPAYVDAIYRNVLGRAPDGSGRAYWVDRLARGTTRSDMLAHVSESPEHQTSRRVAGEITRAYLVLLGRAATPAERTTWLGAYRAGTTGTDMVAILLGSPEYARGE